MAPLKNNVRQQGTQLQDVELKGATVLLGEGSGKYPDANAVLVKGSEETILLDAPLGVRKRAELGSIEPLDRILLSHCHEDHIPALPLFPEASLGLHTIEVPAMADIEIFLDFFGVTGESRDRLRKLSLDSFDYQPRIVDEPFEDEATWSLGAGLSITALHTPGHTPGHCSFLIEPAGLLFLADIDLSSFGPFYADAYASVDDFERSIARVREIDCAYYLSGHHIGLLEGRDAFLDRLGRYGRRIEEREQALLRFLDQPRTLDDIVAHRFIYRAQDTVAGIDNVERKSMTQHLKRLARIGAVTLNKDEAGTSHYQAD